jgi:hypothetical protein
MRRLLVQLAAAKNKHSNKLRQTGGGKSGGEPEKAKVVVVKRTSNK